MGQGIRVSAQYAAALHSFSRPFKVAYPARCHHRSTLSFDYVKAHWKKISMAAAVGMLAGFIAGLVSSRSGVLLSEVVYAASSAPAPNLITAKPSPPPAAVGRVAEEELARLRTQNQQLQTIVAELRRDTPSSHPHRAKAHHRRRGRMHG